VFSSVSVAPSLAQTVASLFRAYDDEEELVSEVVPDDGLLFSAGELPEIHTRPEGFWSVRAWRRYFRPMKQKVYYRALFHLYVINFPFALAAFLFTVVFTVVRNNLIKQYFCAVILATDRDNTPHGPSPWRSVVFL
jgi:hypothetical protein